MNDIISFILRDKFLNQKLLRDIEKNVWEGLPSTSLSWGHILSLSSLPSTLSTLWKLKSEITLLVWFWEYSGIISKFIIFTHYLTNHWGNLSAFQVQAVTSSSLSRPSCWQISVTKKQEKKSNNHSILLLTDPGYV